MKSILDRLQAGWEPLKGLSVRFRAEMSCVLRIVYGRSIPPVNFDKDTVERIAALGAGIDIDLYVLPRR